MHARLVTIRPAAFQALVVLALALSLLLGATVGYVLKPAHASAGPTRYIVVSADTNSGAGGCVTIQGHRGC
jgi:hypothetical protein